MQFLRSIMSHFSPASGTFTPPQPWIDVHAHVLPGIDDGPANWDDALALVAEAEGIGITHIVATPHHSDMYTSHEDQILKVSQEMNTRLSDAGKRMTILPGREVSFTDTHVEEILKSGNLRSPAGAATLLIELPEGINKDTVIKGLFSIMLEELRIVIAHPERNLLIQNDPSFATQLRERGTYMQLDARSLLGTHGPVARKAAEKMLLNRDVDIISSDAHRSGDYKEYARACACALRFTDATTLHETLCATPARVTHINI